MAQNLIVLRTSPGNANALAVALDKEELAGDCGNHRGRRYHAGGRAGCEHGDQAAAEAAGLRPGEVECARFSAACYGLVKLEAHCIMLTLAPAMAHVSERHPIAGLNADGSVYFHGLFDCHPQVATAELNHMACDQAAFCQQGQRR